MSDTQAELRRWINRLVKAHGESEVSLALGFDTEADFTAWLASDADIDPVDVGLLTGRWGVGLMNAGDFEEAERG